MLTDARKTTASKLEDAVVKELKELCMTGVQFKVEMRSLSGGQEVVIGDETVRVTSNGKDDVEFTFSANVGEPLRPLAKIASGGELSRIMLGIKAALAASNVIPTMIFDEVDQGVGFTRKTEHSGYTSCPDSMCGRSSLKRGQEQR